MSSESKEILIPTITNNQQSTGTETASFSSGRLADGVKVSLQSLKDTVDGVLETTPFRKMIQSSQG